MNSTTGLNARFLFPACVALGVTLPVNADPGGELTTPQPSLSTLQDVWERLSFYGDLRLRLGSDDRYDSTRDRQRMRLRMRFGLKYPIAENIEIGARVVTGNDSGHPLSHVDFNDAYGNDPISIDRAYAKWRPGGGDVYLMGGKFSQGWKLNPVYGELLFDGDVQPEGGQAGWSYEGEGMLSQANVVVGQYFVNEGNDTADPEATNVYSTQAQASANLALSEKADVLLALGFQAYTDPAATIGINRGNATSGSRYASDFAILNPILAVDLDLGAQPLSLAAEWWQNLDANPGAAGDKDTGYALGAALGSKKAKGDFKVYYQYQVVEQDSLFSFFAQDDFFAATNFKGHMAGVNYMLNDKVGLHLWAMRSKAEDSTLGGSAGNETRMRIDLNFSF